MTYCCLTRTSKQNIFNFAGADPRTKTNRKKPFTPPPPFSLTLVLLLPLEQNKPLFTTQILCLSICSVWPPPTIEGTKHEHVCELKLKYQLSPLPRKVFDSQIPNVLVWAPAAAAASPSSACAGQHSLILRQQRRLSKAKSCLLVLVYEHQHLDRLSTACVDGGRTGNRVIPLRSFTLKMLYKYLRWLGDTAIVSGRAGEAR